MILLTGSKGFIGRNFLSALKNDVVEVDFEDCFDIFKKPNFFQNLDMILHQGAISSTVETDLRKIIKYNLDFSLELLSAAIKYEIPVKYASSASVYGNLHPRVNPLNLYANSKLLIDYFVEENLNNFKFIQGFRYFNVYGKGEEAKTNQASPISKFSWEAQRSGSIKIFEGSDNFFRDFIFVGDVVNVVLSNNLNSGIFDLGTSSPISFAKVAELVSRKYNARVETIEFPNHLIGKYQNFTKANRFPFTYNFKTVEEYLK